MKFRLVQVSGKEVKIGEPYIMVAIPQRAALKPGEIPNPLAPKINMNMIPANLEVQTEDGEWEKVEFDQGPKIQLATK